MGLSKILLTTVAIIASVYNNVEATMSLCEGITEGVHQIYCLANYPFDGQCHNKKLSVKFYYCKKGFLWGHYKDENDIKRKLKKDNRTTIIIHGYLAHSEAKWISPMVDELHNWQEDMNVIVVQWFKDVRYSEAAKAVDEVANKTANLIKDLYTNKKTKQPIEPQYLHIIGHSLGAHIAGLTASKLKNTPWEVHRVTGLDPAKPFFDEAKNKGFKLNKDCAKFVDVIHTNGGPKNRKTFGLYEPLGHIDFYPNGGDYQPDCTDGSKGRSIEDDDLSECLKKFSTKKSGPALASNFLERLSMSNNMICDHETAPEYFTESLKKKHRFYAKKVGSLAHLSVEAKKPSKCVTVKSNCDKDETCAEMGIYASKYRNTSQGIYLLKTNCDSDETDGSWLSTLSTWLEYFFDL